LSIEVENLINQGIANFKKEQRKSKHQAAHAHKQQQDEKDQGFLRIEKVFLLLVKYVSQTYGNLAFTTGLRENQYYDLLRIMGKDKRTIQSNRSALEALRYVKRNDNTGRYILNKEFVPPGFEIKEPPTINNTTELESEFNSIIKEYDIIE
jgi:hypothetical protein